ncbi:exodeoxyribonuclease V subunit gamma [soil metagenome]
MLNIYKSNSLYKLAEILAKRLRDNTPEDPLDSILVVVPNRDTSRWLKLQLAEINGIAANVEFLLPAEWQFRQIRKLYKNLPTLLPSDPGPLTWTIFGLLMDDEKRHKFSRADQYIKTQPAEIRELAAMQLAEKISSAFDQYLVYRPELILKWQSSGPIRDEDERWQAELWNLLESDRKSREKGTGFPNKADLVMEISEAIETGVIEQKEPVYFFNTGLIPQPIIRLAKNLADHTDVEIFQVSLSRQVSLSLPVCNPLVEAFGDEARGAELLYGKLSGNLKQLYTELSQGNTLLQKIHQSILENDPIESWNAEVDGDTAIEIHSCHTPLREIEVLHQFLLRRFEADPDLHPDDILVVMPDPEIYKPFIHAVFGTKTEGIPEIPYHAGFDSKADYGLTRIFLQLLDLADSRMNISDVMDLFMEEAVRARFDVSEVGAERIRSWMEENNVIWGLDSEHKGQFNQPANELYTWHSAMKRGWMGILLGDQDDPFKDEDLHFLRVRGSDRELEWSSFANFLRQLDDFSKAIDSKKTITDWCNNLKQLIATFFSKEALNSKESDSLFSAIEKIKESAVISSAEEKVSFVLIRRSIHNQLTGNPASTAIFTRGITFSSMVPVRSVPAKIVALIGLNESDFPRKPKHTDFDLMARDPEPTDRNRRSEDRNLFLESIMAAEQFHYCSYIGRSRGDNEPIPPSPVVSEWLTQLGNALEKDTKKLINQEPLHGFSAENFKRKRSYAVTEYSVAKLLAQKKSSHPGLYAGEPLTTSDNNEMISLGDMISFYSNPVRTLLKARFRPNINSAEERRDEFILNNLEKHKLFEQVFGWKLAGRSEEEILNLLNKTGNVAAGWQGESMLRDMVQNTETAIQFMKEKGFDLIIDNLVADILLESRRLCGSVTSYSSDVFLDISPSSYSGSKVFRSWLGHLALTAEGDLYGMDSYYLCDLIKGDPTFITFQPVEDSREVLAILVDMYRSGVKQPLMLFPDTSFEYEKAKFKGKGNEEFKAAATFEADQYNLFAENSDFYLSLFTGKEPSFTTEYINPQFQSVLEIMLNHMDPVK